MKKNLFAYVLAAFFVLTYAVNLSAQNGQPNTKFWFAAPDGSNLHGGCDAPIFIMITTESKPAVVTISIGGVNLVTNQAIAANSFYRYAFNQSTKGKVENEVTQAGIVQNKGILITSSVPVSAYYQVDGTCSKDIYTLKSDKALGTDFYVPMQDTYATYNYTDAYDQIDVVATENNTQVTITPTGKVVAHGGGGVAFPANTNYTQSYTITLNKGQSYLIREYAKNQTPSLQGTHITSNKPIAVTSTEDCLVSGGAIDIVGDQIVPIDNLGTNYVVINGYTSGSTGARDYAYILAVNDNTQVFLSGSTTASATLAKGKSYKVEIPANQAFYIRTSKPAYCYQMSGYLDELGSALIPSMYSISARRIAFYKQTIATSAIFLVFRKNSADGFKINNGAYTATITPQNITGMPDWQYAKVNISNMAEGQCIVENSKSAFALGYFCYGGGTASYGFLSGFGEFTLGGDTTYHCGTSYMFDAGYAKNYLWNLPDGTTSNLSTFTTTKSGKYKVTVDQDPNMIIDSTYLKLQTFPSEFTVSSASIINIPASFSVTLNPLNDPDNVYNAEYLWTFGGGASIATANTAAVNNVIWTTPGIKTVTLKIKNKDANCETTLTKDILFTNYPDNISDATCWVTPTAKNWRITKLHSFTRVHSMSTPLVADLDGDGNPEVIAPRISAITDAWRSDGLIVGNARTLTQREIATIPFALHGQSITIANVNANPETNKDAYIFIQGLDYKIYCYNGRTGTLVRSWTLPANRRYIIQLADLNADNIPELIAGPYIYNARTGVLLVSGTEQADGTGYGNPHRIGENEWGRYRMSAIGDIDGDGKLEIAAGNTVYKATITNSTGTSGNSWAVYRQAAVNSNVKYPDGQTVLVDFDKNGTLDVAVLGNEKIASLDNNTPYGVQFYVWDGQTSNIIGYGDALPNKTCSTIPYVGDLDGDGYVDFAFAVTDISIGMVSYHYDATQPGKIKRGLNKTQFAETSGFTMFDFNQDRKSEIVYRNNSEFYIVDGTTLNPISPTTTLYSGTVAEYPIVADVDNDGSAEIILTHAEIPWTGSDATGYMSVYKGEDQNRWAPARKVWNQWPYNAVHINENMTVPQYEVNPAIVFPGADGVLGTVDDVRPFNSFLQQQTTLNKQGNTLYPTPNAKVVSPGDIRFDYNSETNILTVTGLKVTNVGSATLQAPVSITAYKNTVGSPTKYTYNYPTAIIVGDTKTISFTIPNFGAWLPVNQMVIKVNDSGNGYNNQLVCDSCCVNNESDAFANIPYDNLAWADSYAKNIGDNVNFDATVLPGGAVAYEWWTPSAATRFATSRTASKSNLQLTDAGRYVFKAFNVNGQLNLTYTLPYLSVATSELYWKDNALNSNWNDPANWRSANGNDILAIPTAKTAVHLPDTATFFPSLDTITTPRKIYGDPKADKIYYHFGAQTAFPHLLKYNQAFVDFNWNYYSTASPAVNSQPTVNQESTYPGRTLPVKKALNRGRWYALAAPLKKMVSGDFTLAGYPMTWQSGYNVINPSSGAIVGTDFSKSFPHNDIDLSRNNNAIALKTSVYTTTVGSNSHTNLNGLKGIIRIPYFEDAATAPYRPGHFYNAISGKSSFKYFDAKTLQMTNQTPGSIKRGREAYRFIFETDANVPAIILVNGQNVEGFKMTVNKTVGCTSDFVMIGNPFMAAINAQRFFQANSTKIVQSEGYRLYSNGLWIEYPFTAANNIAPLQAFVVRLANGLTTADLLFPLEGNYALTGPTFKGTLRAHSEQALIVRSLDTENQETEAVLLPVGVSEASGFSQNMTKIIDAEGYTIPEVFFIAGNGEYNAVQLLNESTKDISIAVKTSVTDRPISLLFDQVNTFATSKGVYPILIDNYLNTQQDLTLNNTYSFIQRNLGADKQYTDTERFILRLTTSNTGLNEKNADSFSITYASEKLNVFSSAVLDNILIYDMQGRLVQKYVDIQDTHFTIGLKLSSGVYIVNAFTVNGDKKVERIINK